MHAGLRTLAAPGGVLALVLAIAACGTSAESAGADASSAAPSSAQPSADSGDRVGDPSGIDWATVDLTTIDWATIELSEIDWQAIRDNPTAEDIAEADRALIGSRLDPGHATLTVGDQVYQFDDFLCAFGHEATESTLFSLTTNSFGEFDGVRVQMQATIEDPTGAGRTTGDGLTHRVQLDDITDFENPSVGWSLRSADAIQIDGLDIRAEGTFDDDTTELETEALPGTLEAHCGDQSRR